MKFEEKFPSLKEAMSRNRQYYLQQYGKEKILFEVRDIEENCIDKQRVKDIIEKVLKCQRGKGCRKGFESWACESKRKIYRKLKNELK